MNILIYQTCWPVLTLAEQYFSSDLDVFKEEMYIIFPSDDTFALECLLTEIYWSGYSKDLKVKQLPGQRKRGNGGSMRVTTMHLTHKAYFLILPANNSPFLHIANSQYLCSFTSELSSA